MIAAWILAIALVLVAALWFRLLFYAVHVEGVLRNLVEAVESQGLDEKDMERLHAAMMDARKVVSYASR